MPDFETIYTTHLNLEIIIDKNGELTACKYDVPDELSDLLDRGGEWQEFDPELIAPVKEYFRITDELIAEWSIRSLKVEAKGISKN